MKLLADKKIPNITSLFEEYFEIELQEDEEIKHHSLEQVDVLITRSTLNLNQPLLDKAHSLKLVASPTAGFDHIDTAWLRQRGIHWLHAPGCNAQAVSNYVACCLAYCFEQKLLPKKHCRAGVVGVGHVGQHVVDLLLSLGMDVTVHDPVRSEIDASFISMPLETFADCDLVCLHPALTYQGNHPSYHMINRDFLHQQKKGCVLLNAARGAIINTEDLLRYGQHCHWLLDVYEHEPSIHPEVVKRALIATPHIAGHTQEARWRGIYQVYQGIYTFFNFPIRYPAPPSACSITLDFHADCAKLLTHYHPLSDTTLLKQAMLDHVEDKGLAFLKAREAYRLRSEFI